MSALVRPEARILANLVHVENVVLGIDDDQGRLFVGEQALVVPLCRPP